MTREEAKDVFLNRGFIKVEGCRGRIFHADKWREACVVISEWLKSPEQEPIWIPCSERLPGDREIVLLSTETDKVFEGRFYDDNTDCQWYVFRNETFLPNHVVTAWMPLPKGYKAESEVKDGDNGGENI